MNRHKLEVDSVRKNFGDLQVLSDVYLRCETGEVIGLLGRNGCGKSTLLKIIFGSLDTYNKSIRINNKVYPYLYKEKDQIAYLPQDSFLPGGFGLKALTKFFLADKKRRDRVLADERVRKHLHKNISELSGGERRYFEILLLVNLPAKFILIDEPFAGIEPLYKERIKALINDYRSEKGFIITDHDYKNIIEVSDKIVLLVDGACKHIRKPEELEQFNYLPKGTLTQRQPDQKASDSSTYPFEIDEQTRKDLHLQHPYGEESVFSILNHTRSKGGRAYLEKILQSPISNRSILEQRRDTIRYFHEKGIDLRVDKKQLDFVEYYITSGIVVSRRSYFDSFITKIKERYRPTNDYYIITTGIQNTINFLNYFLELIAQLLRNEVPQYLAIVLLKAEAIINKPEMRMVARFYAGKGNYKTGELDFAFRRPGMTDILELLNIIYELEAYWSVSVAARGFGWNYPEYSNASDLNIEMKGLYHPMVEHAVANDFIMNYSRNFCFLTGANMSGKSTFLKSFGIAVYLAHIGFPVPAERMKTSVFNGMITTINLSDNINKGYSHFYSEVNRVKQAALEIKKNKRMIVIFDELFRGTNVKDASDASLMIISAFSKIRSSLFVVSTHIVEIAKSLEKHSNLFFTCFDTHIQNDKPVYQYKLREGVSTESLGLLIVRDAGIIDLLEEAQKNKMPDQIS